MNRFAVLAVSVVLPLALTSAQTIAKGPKFGSVPGGAIVSTDAFLPASAPSGPGPVFREPRNKIPIKPSPVPALMDVTVGEEGSNYIIDPSVAGEMPGPPPLAIASFQGIPDQGISIPPDPYMAAGPTHVLAVVNSRFRISTKSGAALKTIEAEPWFASVLSNNDAFDPKVLYDHFAGRWVMVWLEQSDSRQTSHYLLSVSDDADPQGTWYNWALPATVLGDSADGAWADYEGVGFDSEALYITSNKFSFGGSYRYVSLRIIPKAQLYGDSAGTVTWTDFWDLKDPGGSSIFGARPSIVHGFPGEYYVVGIPFASTANYAVILVVNNPLGSTTIGAYQVPVVRWYEAPDPEQLGGGSPLLDGGGSRIRNEPTYRDSSLWFVHAVASGSLRQYSSVRYVRINTVTRTAVEDIALGADGFWHTYPALAVDKDENLALTFTRSGTTEFAGAYMSWRLATDAPGLRPSVTIQTGKANYVKTVSSGRNRWGDYNGVMLDPADQNDFWMFTEYADSPANTWGTWFFHTRLIPYPGARLVYTPPSRDFGIVEAAFPSDTATVTIYNYGSSPLTVTSIANGDAAYRLLEVPALPATISTYDSVAFKVSFLPSGHGVIQDTIVISTNDGTNPNGLIALRGKGIVIGRAQAGVMYAASASLPVSQLYTVNTVTGSATPIGATGVFELHSLAVRPSNKEMYATYATSTNTILYRVASANGDALPAAVIPIPYLRAIAFGNGDTLFGGTQTGKLYRINIGTGDTVLVGTAAGIVYSALSFNPVTGKLWASVRPAVVGKDRIYIVDTMTGDTTLVGATGDNAQTPSLTFGPRGELYGLKGTGTQTNTLIAVDTTTAVGTLIGSTNVQGLLAIEMRTDSVVTSISSRLEQEVPATYVLNQNFPNPFNPTTVVSYQLSVASDVKLVVYDFLGREVAVLVNERKAPGSYEVTFDGSNLASGVYIYRIGAGQFVAARKMLLVQ